MLLLTEPGPWGRSYVQAACNETREHIPANVLLLEQ